MRLSLRVSVLFIFLILINNAFADGSKDLYPSGVRGGRAFLESLVTNGSGNPSHPFYNNARHYAYVKANEILAVASSANGIGNGRIVVYSPSGVAYVSNSVTTGRIYGHNGLSNREAELAGPRIGYDAYEILAEEEGIWTIEFFAPDGNASIPNVLADDNWTQTNNQNFISAWDVSVRNTIDTEWVKGRVFTNVLNLYMHGGNMNDIERAYFGINYVLTKDGYYYRVDGNGAIGLRFTYFVNNSGFLNPDRTPSYKSSVRGYNASIHDPNSSDISNEFVTHKIFYTLPDLDLPKESFSKFGNTWLLNEIEIASVSNISFEPSEGTSNKVNTKGSKIKFDTNFEGRYKVVISSNDSNKLFPDREIIVQALVGTNEVIWDGRDGEGKILTNGNHNIQIKIASIEGEVHFPYFDTEINPNGLKLERVNRKDGTIEPAILYWDDSDVPQGGIVAEYSSPIVNLQGISSHINGHRWGTYSLTTPGGNINNNLYTGSNSFGNNMAMDTWSYAVQVEEVVEESIEVQIADLEVVSIEADKDTIELEESITYTIKVKNNGPSDITNGKFEYQLPLGFYIDDIKFDTGECFKIYDIRIENNNFIISLDLKNACEVELKVITHAKNVPDETYGYVSAEGGIVRPPGITDPDATSSDYTILMPGTAKEECSPEGCNNIKVNNKVFLLEPINERGKIALLKEVKHIDANNSGFHELGETLEYTFTIRNTGLVTLKDIFIVDSLLSSSKIELKDIELLSGEEYSLKMPYVISNQDLLNKKVINSAQVVAKNPRKFDVKDISGTTIENDDKTKIDIDQAPEFKLKKSVVNLGTGENSQFTIGDIITYKFEIKHSGEIAINNILLIDHMLFAGSHTLPIDLLQNDKVEYEFNYTITADDILKGELINSALLQGNDLKYQNTLSDSSGTDFNNNFKTVTPLAKPPIARPDYVEVHQSQLTTLHILDNDQKGSSNWDKGKIEIIDYPSLGAIQINGVDITYLQHNNFSSGDDYFTYRIFDNSRLQSEIVRVDIEIIKTVPHAVDDHFTQNYNKSIVINPAKNDYVEYTELDLESIEIINYPNNGKLTYQGNGTFVYESYQTFSGIDEFTYRIKDKNGNVSEPAKVTISISGILIPNVITPNGDGMNDKFVIIGLYEFENVELTIFDRFKNLIYQNSDYKNDWEVNSSVQDGTYFYMLRMNKKNEKPIIKRGSLLITRQALN